MPHKYIVGAIIGVGALCVLAFYEPIHTEYKNLSIQQHLPDTTLAAAGVALASQNSPTLLAVGDIMLGRQVEAFMNGSGDDYPFQKINDVLESVDSVVANFEGPVLKDHPQTPSGSTLFAFDPRMPGVLFDHNVGIVNLANNHTYDFGVSGFSQTTAFLDAAHVLHAGNPFALGDEYVLRTTLKGKKFIFVGFNITNPNFNFAAAHEFVKNLNKAPDEFLIAMCHGGEEYELHSNARQEDFYRGFIDDGVDLVLAHHPHVVEEIEQYKNKLIFYSLGNFIFDQYFSTDVEEELAVKISFTQNAAATYELLPVKSVRSQPELMNEADKADFLSRLAARSSPALQDAIRQGVIDIN